MVIITYIKFIIRYVYLWKIILLRKHIRDYLNLNIELIGEYNDLLLTVLNMYLYIVKLIMSSNVMSEIYKINIRFII